MFVIYDICFRETVFYKSFIAYKFMGITEIYGKGYFWESVKRVIKGINRPRIDIKTGELFQEEFLYRKIL